MVGDLSEEGYRVTAFSLAPEFRDKASSALLCALARAVGGDTSRLVSVTCKVRRKALWARIAFGRAGFKPTVLSMEKTLAK